MLTMNNLSINKLAIDIWKNFISVMKNNLHSEEFSNWFLDLEVISHTENTIVIRTPSLWHEDYILANYKQEIDELLTQRFVKLSFEYIEPLKQSVEERKHSIHIGTDVPCNKPKRKIYKNSFKYCLPISNTFKLSSYLEGIHNCNAKSLAYNLLSSQGFIYSPSCIYGESGLGKTHLISAILQSYFANENSFKYYYSSTQSFVDEICFHIKNKTLDKFKNDCENVNIFILDDIDSLDGKIFAQDFLNNLIDTLTSKESLIIFTAISHPLKLSIKQKLKSRLKQGMIENISSPDVEFKKRLSSLIAENLNIKISDKKILEIAKISNGDAREIEGRIKQYHRNNSALFNPSIIYEIDSLIDLKFKNIKFDNKEVIKSLKKYLGISSDDLLNNTNKKASRIRDIIIFVIYKINPLISMKKIGDLFCRSHTSISRSITRTTNRICVNFEERLAIINSLDLLKKD